MWSSGARWLPPPSWITAPAEMTFLTGISHRHEREVEPARIVTMRTLASSFNVEHVIYEVERMHRMKSVALTGSRYVRALASVEIRYWWYSCLAKQRRRFASAKIVVSLHCT
jgi:hypothetical protein